MTKTDCLIVVEIARTEEKLHPYDISVPGVYLAQGIAGDLSDELRCETALESFHESCAIKVLDDFNIRVVDVERKIELEPSIHVIDDLQSVDCYRVGDEVPDWVRAILDTPAPESRIEQDSPEP